MKRVFKTSAYTRGRKKEYTIRLRELNRPEVYECVRSAKSLSPVDLTTLAEDGTHLIQVKSSRPSRKVISDLEPLADDLLCRYAWVVVVKRGEEWWRFFPVANAHCFSPGWYRHLEGIEDSYEQWEPVFREKKKENARVDNKRHSRLPKGSEGIGW